MIKLVNLFEDIKVEPRFTLIFKIPFKSAHNTSDEYMFDKAVEMRREAVLSELIGYKGQNKLSINRVYVSNIQELDNYVEARCISVGPDPGLLYGFPEGFSFDVTGDWIVTGFIYLATRGKFLKPGELKGIYRGSIDIMQGFTTWSHFKTPQSALDYLLFK